jgi:hypothetical protein
MKLLGRSKLIKVVALVLAVMFGSQQVGWAEYIDLRDGAGFEDYALAVAAGGFSSYSMNPSWNVVQMFAYTYLIPLAADKITEDIENPYLRAGASAFISAFAVGALDGAFTSDKIGDRSSQAIGNAERASATTAQSAAQQAAANAAKNTAQEVTKEMMKGALIKGALTTGLAHAAAAVVGEYADQHGWGRGWGFLAKVVTAQLVQGAAESALRVEQVVTKDGPAYVKADQGGIFEGAIEKLTDERFLTRLKVEVARVTIEELAVRAGMDEDLVTAVGAGLSRVLSYKWYKVKETLQAQKEQYQQRLDKIESSTELDQDSQEVKDAVNSLNRQIEDLDKQINVSDIDLFLQGVRIGLVSAGLQYLSKQTKSPLHGAVFLAGASSLLQGVMINPNNLVKAEVSDEKSQNLGNLYAQNDAEAARDTRLNQIYNSSEQDGEVRNELHTLLTTDDATTALQQSGSSNIDAEISPEKKGLWLYLDLLQDTITSANADFYSFGRATYRPVGGSFEFAWQSGNDAFFAARYTGYQKMIRDKGFVTALAYQLASSYFYQAVHNVDSVVSGDINRQVYLHDKTVALQMMRQNFLLRQNYAQLDKQLKESQLLDKILGVDGLEGIKEGLKKAQAELDKQHQAPDQDYNEVRNKIHELLEVMGELYKKQGELEQELKDFNYTPETTPKELIEQLKVKIEDLKAQVEKARADKADDKVLTEKLRVYELKKLALERLDKYEKAEPYLTQVRNKNIIGLIKDYALLGTLWGISPAKIWDSPSDNVPAPGALIPILAARDENAVEKDINQKNEELLAALYPFLSKEDQAKLTNAFLNVKLASEAYFKSVEDAGVSETRALKAVYGDVYNFDYYGGIQGFKARYGDKVLVGETIPEDLKQAYREEQQSRVAAVLLPVYTEQVRVAQEESIKAEIVETTEGLSDKEIKKQVDAEIYKQASALANQKAAEYITNSQGDLTGLVVLSHLNGVEYSQGVSKLPLSSTSSVKLQMEGSASSQVKILGISSDKFEKAAKWLTSATRNLADFFKENVAFLFGSEQDIESNVPVTAPDESDDFNAYLESKHPPVEVEPMPQVEAASSAASEPIDDFNAYLESKHQEPLTVAPAGSVFKELK